MKPEQLAKRLNVTSATLRNWAAKDVTEFLSPLAQGQNGARRSFSDRDARILGWVAQMREQNIPLADIIDTLRSAQEENWRNLPELPSAPEDEVALVPREAVEERVKALQEKYELQIQAAKEVQEKLEAQLAELKAENTDLRQRYMAITDQLMDLNKRLTGLLEKERRQRK